MEPLRTEEYLGYTVKVYLDENPEDPRDWDNLGTMLCKHHRYNLGDYKISKTMSPEEIQEYVRREDVLSLSLYLYDHSGLYLKSSRNGNPWGGRLPQGHAEFDTSMVGWITITYDKIRDEMARPKPLKKGQKNPDLSLIKRLTKKDKERAIRYLESEVETYSDYLGGNVVGYAIERDGEQFDSCWGFYPEHNGHYGGFEKEFGYVLSECRSIIDSYVKEDRKEAHVLQNVTHA